MAKRLPSFQEVYDCLCANEPATVTSTRGKRYSVYAELRRGQPVIVGYPRRGQVVVHKDCWGSDTTCQGTRAGGIFNGSPSIYDWFNSRCGRKA
jgi:hypothetical protein